VTEDEVPRRLGPPVEASAAGLRVDQFLAENFPFLSRHGWQKRIRERRLFVNQRATSCAYRLRAGDEISHLMPPGAEPETCDDIRLIHADDWLLAAAKPPNLPMHEGGYYHRRTFVRYVRERFGELWSPVHRLDLDTSGLVLCTKDSQTREFIAAQFRERRIEKTYIFLTAVTPAHSAWEVDEPLGMLPFMGYLRHWRDPHGKSSQTGFAVVGKFGDLTLIRAWPLTGRTLQIRIHAALSGVPILGDKLCHPDPAVYVAYKEHGHSPELNRITGHHRACLHSESLRFAHPNRREPVALRAEMADDMQKRIEPFLIAPSIGDRNAMGTLF
jgi:RluA family pseudouridine synthase